MDFAVTSDVAHAITALPGPYEACLALLLGISTTLALLDISFSTPSNGGTAPSGLREPPAAPAWRHAARTRRNRKAMSPARMMSRIIWSGRHQFLWWLPP